MPHLTISPFPLLAKTTGWRCTDCHHIGPQEDMCPACDGGDLVPAGQPFPASKILHRSVQVLAAVILVVTLIFGGIALSNGNAVYKGLSQMSTSSEYGYNEDGAAYGENEESYEYQMYRQIAKHHTHMGLLMVFFGIFLSGLLFWRSKPDSIRDPIGLVLLLLLPSFIFLSAGIGSNYGYLYFAGMPGVLFGFVLAYFAITLHRQNWNLRLSLQTQCGNCNHMLAESNAQSSCPNCQSNVPTPIATPTSQWRRDNLLITGIMLVLTLANIIWQIRVRLEQVVNTQQHSSTLHTQLERFAEQDMYHWMQTLNLLNTFLSVLLILSLLGIGIVRSIYVSGRQTPLWLPVAILILPMLIASAAKANLVSLCVGIAFVLAIFLFRGPSRKPIAPSPA